ncbi:hypothetical protein [Nonomuraea diastatica]|uniref:Uncharacterized protein n=1 Tax=Nonomuraea diastatica TaxID=1848329 RepID=A0A4R4WZ50_9ACTN|nr:hypothetical protein [Nonomuraea diastatica]TDD23146.1 hypothetical protein E1294_09950 [Nonomuraea diastatica]
MGTATPTLWAKLRDDDSVRGRFEWWDGESRAGEFVTPTASSGNAFYAGVPAGAYEDGSVIRWRCAPRTGEPPARGARGARSGSTPPLPAASRW